MSTLTSIILAGGASTRMGQDKALLNFNDNTLLAHAHHVLSSVPQITEIMVSGNRPGFDCVEDIHPNLGPLGGIYSVIKKRNLKSVIIIPVDMPNLNASLIKNLINASEQTELDAVHFKDKLFPLLLRINARVIEVIDDCIQQKSLGMHVFLTKLTCQEVMHQSDEMIFMNLNNPTDWQQFNEHQTL